MKKKGIKKDLSTSDDKLTNYNINKLTIIMYISRSRDFSVATMTNTNILCMVVGQPNYPFFLEVTSQRESHQGLYPSNDDYSAISAIMVDLLLLKKYIT